MGEIVINGKARPLAEPVSLPALLAEMQIETRWALVERNGEPVNRTDYETTIVRPGDKIEIATPMAGG